MILAIESITLNLTLSTSIDNSFDSLMEFVDKMDTQLEETEFEEAGYSSVCYFLDSKGKKVYEEGAIKDIIVSYNFGQVIDISHEDLLSLVKKMINQKEQMGIKIDFSSVKLEAHNDRNLEVLNTNIL